MRKLRVLVMCAVAVLATVGVAPEAEAARRTGLADSELIEDKDDVFLYPQLVLDYDNLISFEYGAAQNSGSGLFIAGGDTFALGVAVHRGDLFGAFQDASGGQQVAFAGQQFPYNSPVTTALGSPSPLVSGVGGVSLDPSGMQNALTPHTMFDVMGGFDLGDAGKLGARVSLGVGGSSNKPPEEDRTSQGQINFLFTGGYSLEAGDLSLDTSLNMAIGSADQNNLGNGDDVAKGNRFGLNLGSRLYYALNESTRLGGLFDIGFNNLKVTQEEPQEFDATLKQFGFQIGAGPVYTIGGNGEQGEDPTKKMSAGWGAPPPQTEEDSMGEPVEDTEDEDTRAPARRTVPEHSHDTVPEHSHEPKGDEGDEKQGKKAKAKKKDKWTPRATIAGYGVFGVGTTSLDPNSDQDDDNQSASAIVIPGFHAAAEIQLLKWFYFRSGVKYWFQHNNTKQATPNGDQKGGSDVSQFAWNAGVGFETHGFRLDAALSNQFVTNGPQFISGNTTGPLFTIVSAQYHW